MQTQNSVISVCVCVWGGVGGTTTHLSVPQVERFFLIIKVVGFEM